jgi:hypothetical protein
MWMTLAKQTFKKFVIAAFALGACVLPARAQSVTPAETPAEAKAIAEDAYIYGYSLISVEMSRKVITNVEKPETKRAPMGQFANLHEYPNTTLAESYRSGIPESVFL